MDMGDRNEAGHVEISSTGMSGGTNYGAAVGTNHGTVTVTTSGIKELGESEIMAKTEGMVEVAALEKVVEKLEAGGRWISILGNPGDGKTTLGYMALKKLKEGRKNMRVYRTNYPNDFGRLLNDNDKNCVVILDDVFGRFVFDLVKLREWIQDIGRFIESQTDVSDGIRVIFISRWNVIQEALKHLEEYADYIIDKTRVYDLREERGNQEKLNILECHLNKKVAHLTDEVKKQIIEKKLPHGFPHCCKIYFKMILQPGDNTCKDIVVFFTSPLEFLNKATNSLAAETDYLSLFKKMIESDGKLDITEEDENLQNASTALLGSYLVNNLDGDNEAKFVVFSHQAIYQSVAQVVATKNMRFFVEYANLSFLQDTLKIKAQGQNTKPGYINLELTRRDIEILAARFKEDVSRRRRFGVFSSELIDSRLFCEILVGLAFHISGSDKQDPKTDVNITDEVEEWAPSFHWLCCRKSPPDIENKKLLLEHTDDVNIKDEDGWTPLHWLCNRESPPDIGVVTLLLEHKADVNIKDEKGNTPLIWLCSKRSPPDIDIMKLLLEHKADVNIKDEKGNTPLIWLCSKQSPPDIDFMKLLLEHKADVNIKDEKGNTPLIWLCSGKSPRDINFMKLLLEHKADVNIKDEKGNTPLIWLCSKRSPPDIDIMKLLLEHKADVNIKDEKGNTPLIWLCRKQSPPDIDFMKLLLEHKADVNIKDKNGNTPLLWLCSKQSPPDIDFMKLLLEHKADVNIKDEKGNTPLIWLCSRISLLDLNFMKLLLEYKADVNIKDEKGNTPLIWLCSKRSPPDIDIMKLLLEHKADVNIKDEKGNTPLIWLCRGKSSRDINFMKMLLEHKADVNIKDEKGNTPLLWLCSNQSPPDIDFMKLLLEHKADVNIQNRCGSTPLHLLCGRESIPGIKIVKLLLEHKADVYLQNSGMKTPLDCLNDTVNPDFDLVNLLRAHMAGLKVNTDKRSGSDSEEWLRF